MRPAMKRRAGLSGSFNGPGAVPRTIDIGAINAPSGHIWLEWCSDKISRNFGEIPQVDNKMGTKIGSIRPEFVPESSILVPSADFQEGPGTPHNRGAPMNLLNFAEALLVFLNIRILF
ncbi:hypothetical protein HFO97_33980 [Rhizobium leguminosarum]|uniref:hypothetical protein n=1 Tax=Rhizobium leguminosarum TaxID=384 RepID=UPI001C95A07F|nr:hypothetical protein [Rhizobium leguminosarum]MBY5364853.1 hypothetical protein [Rhizobium leguminosarum]